MGMLDKARNIIADIYYNYGNPDPSGPNWPDTPDTSNSGGMFPNMGANAERFGARPFGQEAQSVISESLGDIIRGWGNGIKQGLVSIDDVPANLRANVEHFIDYTSNEVPEGASAADDLTGVDPDLEGTAAADDLQIQNILNQATEFTAGANGFAAVFEELELDELNENLGEIEKEYVKRLQNELLRGGGIGWEFNPKDGDSIFFKLPVVIPGMSGIMKIKIKNPDGTFKTAGEIAAETGTQIEAAVNEVVALPGKLMEQAGEILGQSGELAEILAGTSDKTIEEALGDIFGGIFGAEGETDTSGIWDILIGQLTQETIANESTEGGLLAGVGLSTETVLPEVPTGDRSDDTVTSPFPEPTEAEPKVAPVPEVPTGDRRDDTVVDPLPTGTIAEPKVAPVPEVPVVGRRDDTVVDPLPTGTTGPTKADPTVDTTEDPTDPVDPTDPTDPTDPVVEPPPPTGGGGGGGGGFASGRVIGEAPMLQLPAFRPVMPQQKDYTVALNNIIQESLFEGMI